MKYYIIILIITIGIIFPQDTGYVDSTKIKNPKIAFRLGFIHGLGQLYNEKYFKAIGFVAGEYLAISQFNKFKELNNIGLRNTYAWWIFGLYVLGIMDAYVDAQLSTFPNKKIDSVNMEDSLKVNIK